MPTYHMTFDLNSADDVNVLAERFRMLAENLVPTKKPNAEIDEGYIYVDELCKRIKRGKATVAKWRGEHMPYMPGKPCTYNWKEVEAWVKKHKTLGERIK